MQVLLRQLVGISDNVMVGNLGPIYMASLRIATSYFFFFIVLIFAFSSSGGVVASHSWGRKDITSFKKDVGTTIFFSTIVSVIFALILFFKSDFLTKLMIDNETIIYHSKTYLKIISLAFVLNGFNMALSIGFTSSGSTKYPFYVQIITTVLNLILNYLLIYGNFGFPKMTVAGAAWASVISTLIGTIVLIIFAIKNNKMPSLKNIISPYIDDIKEMLKVGLPILADMLSWQMASMVYLSFIGRGKNPTEDMAVYGVIGLFISILFIFISGFVSGTGIVVGQLIGAGLKDKSFEFAKKSHKYSVIISFIPSLIIIISSFVIPHFFKLEGYSYSACVICLIILAFRQGFATTNGVLASTIRSGKDSMSCFIITLSSFLLIGLPLTFLAGPVFKFGVVIIFSGMTIEEIVKAVIFYIRFRSKKWILER